MGKPASDATLLRQARAELKRETEARRLAEQQRDAYRARATAAEQEVAAWKARFDMLLQKAGPMRVPHGEVGSHDPHQ